MREPSEERGGAMTDAHSKSQRKRLVIQIPYVAELEARLEVHSHPKGKECSACEATIAELRQEREAMRQALHEDAEFTHYARHGEDITFVTCTHPDCVGRRTLLSGQEGR